jgi:hypothetical protein
MALHKCFSQRTLKNITSALSRDAFALVQAILMARLDMQLTAIHNATIQTIHA